MPIKPDIYPLKLNFFFQMYFKHGLYLNKTQGNNLRCHQSFSCQLIVSICFVTLKYHIYHATGIQTGNR